MENVEVDRIRHLAFLVSDGTTLTATAKPVDDIAARIDRVVRFAHVLIAAARPDAPMRQQRSVFRATRETGGAAVT